MPKHFYPWMMISQNYHEDHPHVCYSLVPMSIRVTSHLIFYSSEYLQLNQAYKTFSCQMSIFLVLFSILKKKEVYRNREADDYWASFWHMVYYIIMLSFGFGWNIYPYKAANIPKEINFIKRENELQAVVPMINLPNYLYQRFLICGLQPFWRLLSDILVILALWFLTVVKLQLRGSNEIIL